MSKDVIIAGAIAVGCIALIAVAFIAPKSKSTEPEAPKTDVTTTVTEPSLNGPSTFGPTPGLDPNVGFNTNPNSAPGSIAGLPPAGIGGLPPVNAFPPGGSNFPPAHSPLSSTAPAFGGFNSNLPGPTPTPTTVETPAPTPEGKTHTVASGELLGDIALKYYGSSKAWKKIQEANPGLDPKNLKVGQKLVIPAADAKAADTPSSTVATGAGERSYTVKSGDTLYVIAKKELGSASRWKDIEKLNNLSSSELRVGQAIKLPTTAADATPTTGTTKGATDTAPAAGGKTHTVAKGETLGDISKKYYGTTKNWKKIVDANPGVSPENLKVGEKLAIPEIAGASSSTGAGAGGTPTDSAAAPAAAGEYTIKAGDTLGSIAQKELGSKNKWKEIQDANPGLDPRNLRAGQKIKVPGKAADKAPEKAPAAPALPGAAPKPVPNGGFGAPTGAGPGFGGPGPGPAFGAPAGGQQATAFPTDSSFSSPYGGSGFGQPSQPFGQTGPGFSQTGTAPAAEPFPGSQPAPFGGPGAGFPPAGTTDQPLR